MCRSTHSFGRTRKCGIFSPLSRLKDLSIREVGISQGSKAFYYFIFCFCDLWFVSLDRTRQHGFPTLLTQPLTRRAPHRWSLADVLNAYKQNYTTLTMRLRAEPEPNECRLPVRWHSYLLSTSPHLPFPPTRTPSHPRLSPILRSPKPNPAKLQSDCQFPLQCLFVFVPWQVERAETRRARRQHLHIFLLPC